MYLPPSDRVADGHVVEIQSTLARVSVRSEERFKAAENEDPLSVLEPRPLVFITGEFFLWKYLWI